MMFGVEWMARQPKAKAVASASLGMGGEATYRLGMSWPYGIYIQHEWYRLITACSFTGLDSHWLQHDGPHADRPGARRAIRFLALFFSLYHHRRVRFSC